MVAGARYASFGMVMALVVLAVILGRPMAGEATSGGSAYDVPGAVDVDPSATVLETTLVADETTVDLGFGKTAKAQAYNGGIPGPTLRLKVGDTVIVHYENKLEHASAIHWHGIELANAMDGTTFTQNMVEPGGKFLYRFKVTRPGLFWYHPHHHSSTNQVFKGLYGLIVVTDPNEAALVTSGTLPGASATRTLALSDATICKAPGSNDAATYSPTAPWVGGGALPAQTEPRPLKLCETAPIDEDGAARGPYAAGDIPAIQAAATSGRTNEGQTVLTNGRQVGARGGDPASPGALAPGAEQFPVRAGQGVRLQLVNTAAVRYFRLRLTTEAGAILPLVRVGGEGGLLDAAVVEGGVLPGGLDTLYTTGEILLPPGARADVVVAIPQSVTQGDTLTLWTEDFFRTGQGFSNIPTVPVAHMRVQGAQAPAFTIAAGKALRSATGDPVESLPPATGSLFNPAAFSPAKTGMPNQDVVLQSVNGGTALGVNTFFGTHDVAGDYSAAPHLGSTRYARQGDVLQLTVTNGTDANHPFHMHGFSIQPISLTRPANPTFTWPYKEFRDNVDVPARYTLTFRARLEARPQADGTTAGGAAGRWVFHCHIFFHATNGMLSELVVVPSTGNERPDVNADAADVTVAQGATATVTGKVSDRDGDAVTLSSSIGSVVKNPGGTWTWTYPTGTDDSRTVFVTGVDPSGQRSQIPFSLTITNSAPVAVVPGAQTVAQGQPLSFGVSGTDPDAPDVLTLAAIDLPAGLALADKGDRTGTVSGVVTAAPGAYTATISVKDPKNPAATAQVPITVTPAVADEGLTALVGRTERLVKKGITVGCRVATPSLASCAAEVRAAARRVGSATKTTVAAGRTSLSVFVALDARTRSSVARSLAGRKVTVNLRSRKTGAAIDRTASATTFVVPPRITVTAKAFGKGRSATSAAGKRYLRKLVTTLNKKAVRITCIGRADRGQSRRRGAARALARAKSACAVLRKAGLKAKFRTVARRTSFGTRVSITVER